MKVKKEIVTFRQGSLNAESLRLAPERLAEWLDECRDIVLLDTRNAYESRLGTF